MDLVLDELQDSSHGYDPQFAVRQPPIPPPSNNGTLANITLCGLPLEKGPFLSLYRLSRRRGDCVDGGEV